MNRIIITLILFANGLISLGQDSHDCKLLYLDSLINFDRVGAIKIGDNLNQIVERYSFKIGYNAYDKYCNDELIMRIWTKNDSLISGIEILSNTFKTIEGIHVGMSVEELLLIFPKQKMGYTEYEEEYLVIEKYTKEKQRILIAYISSEKQLGKYNESFETYEYDTDGVIVRIELYDWN